MKTRLMRLRKLKRLQINMNFGKLDRLKIPRSKKKRMRPQRKRKI